MFVLVIASFSLLSAFTIGSIDNISNPKMRFNYDLYSGPILNFENRLILGNNAKTEELLIHPNGQLEHIGLFDHQSSHGLVNEDRYILPMYRSHGGVTTNGLYIFDLSEIPMTEIAYVEMYPSLSHSITVNELFFSDTHILIGDYIADRIHLICKETYTYTGFIPGLGYGFYEQYDDKFLHITYTTHGLKIRLFSLNENDGIEEISSLDIDAHGTGWGQISVVNSTAIMITADALLFIDIGDAENPFIANILEHELSSFHYTESYVYGYDRQGYLVVYELDSLGDFHLVHSQYVEGRNWEIFGISPYNIRYIEPYIYLSAEIAVLVFDTTNDFDLINHYGHRVLYPAISLSENDIYFMENDFFDNTQRIYSVIDNSLIAVLNYDHMFHPGIQERFKIIDDRLYISVNIEGAHYFDIYLLENQQATLINRNHIYNSNYPTSFNIVGDRMYYTRVFSSSNTDVSVYSLSSDDTISYIGTFPGKIQYTFSDSPTDFVLNISDGTIFARNVIDILYEKQLSYINDSVYLHYFDENHFVLTVPNTNDPPDAGRLYFFDMDDGSVNMLRSFNTSNLIPFNGVLTATSTIRGNNKSEFFAIHGSQVASIGSFDYDKREATSSNTYFFPERRKMVLVASGGIWVYDFDYSVSDNDVSILPLKNELLGNYPNPFNPETTISFSLKSDSFVNLNIYNIKGQKVKSLTSDFYRSGTHQVIWNGTDENGRNAGSGIYLYNMTAGEYTQTRRMVLMK